DWHVQNVRRDLGRRVSGGEGAYWAPVGARSCTAPLCGGGSGGPLGQGRRRSRSYASAGGRAPEALPEHVLLPKDPLDGCRTAPGCQRPARDLRCLQGQRHQRRRFLVLGGIPIQLFEGDQGFEGPQKRQLRRFGRSLR
ncbi:unnamed protein product, partial [Symbiodinium microadriaticum]